MVLIEVRMKANFFSMRGVPTHDLDAHATWLASHRISGPGIVQSFSPNVLNGYENHARVDVAGAEFKWMNETFTKDKFTWYLWYESVFVVPEEMVPFLMLRWT